MDLASLELAQRVLSVENEPVKHQSKLLILCVIKVRGFAIAYAIVPLDESDCIAEGQVIVDFASTDSDIELDPKNGSFLPHC